jgi:hypothetical protein
LDLKLIAVLLINTISTNKKAGASRLFYIQNNN